MMQNILKLIESVLESEAVQRKVAELLYEVAEAINPESVPLGWERVWTEHVNLNDGCWLELHVDHCAMMGVSEMTAWLIYPISEQIKLLGTPINTWTDKTCVFHEFFDSIGADDSREFGKDNRDEAIFQARDQVGELKAQGKVYIKPEGVSDDAG